MPPPGLASCEQTGPISAAELQYHACDAVLERVVLDCAWPGCDIPPQWCDSHHVLWWTHGGKTVISNLVLLSPPSHRDPRRRVDRDDARRRPAFIPPAWIDPDRAPLRNTYHQRASDTRRLGQRLQVNLPIRSRPDTC